MTTSPDPAFARSLGRWLLLMGLALSVLFNVFFAAGYIRATSNTSDIATTTTDGDDAPQTRQIENELNLTPDQQLAFDEARLAASEDLQAIQDRMTLARQSIIAELQRPDPQLERLMGAVREEAELYGQKRLVEIERLNSFLQTLSPQQSEKLGGLISQRARGLDRHRRIIEQFDADGDGVLDAAEREKAETAMREHRREREQRHQERSERFRRAVEEKRREFDTDGDGQLNATEEQAFRTWLQEKREEWRRERGERGGGRGGWPRHRRGGDRPPPPPADEDPGSIASVIFVTDTDARLMF